MDYGKALITEFLDPDEVSRGVRDRVARGEPFDVYLAREGYRRIIPDIPYYEYVPIFSVVKAFGITGEKIRLLYDLYLKCSVYKNKSPQYADLISIEEKKNHVGQIVASFYVSVIMHNAQAISESNAWAIVKILRENISIVLNGHILKEELYSYMAAAGEQQVSSADGLPMPCTQPQMVINNVAQAYSQVTQSPPIFVAPQSSSKSEPSRQEDEYTPSETHHAHGHNEAPPEPTRIPVNVPSSRWAGKTPEQIFMALKDDYAPEVIALIMQKVSNNKTECGKALSLGEYNSGKIKDEGNYRRFFVKLLEAGNSKYSLTFNK
ncbi:hypothetical protein [Desulfovibrio sp.]|uniref:hypothetical protein n=1 Tax=Desulfovibrio sp. TaxID=885 RepID=UPI0035B447E9